VEDPVRFRKPTSFLGFQDDLVVSQHGVRSPTEACESAIGGIFRPRIHFQKTRKLGRLKTTLPLKIYVTGKREDARILEEAP